MRPSMMATHLAYVEVLPDERRGSTTGFLIRALCWFRERGIRVERVTTDNGAGYIAKLFRKVLRVLGIRHIRPAPARRRPMARPSVSPRPCCANGPMPSRSRLLNAAPPTSPDGWPGTIIKGPMLASTEGHPLRLSQEQPDHKSQLGPQSSAANLHIKL